MTYTLYDLMYKCLAEMDLLTEGIASGGTDTTIIDADATGTKEIGGREDDYFNGGIAGISYDQAGAGAAPQGEFSEVSDFVQTNPTITLQDALTVAVAAGDHYWVSKRRFAWTRIRQALNTVLDDIEVRSEDTTTITTAAQQTEYDLPANVKQLREVYIQATIGDPNDNDWKPWNAWEVIKTGIGTANKLLLTQQPPTGRVLRLVFSGPHPPLRIYSSQLDEDININVPVYGAVAELHAVRATSVPVFEAEAARYAIKFERAKKEHLGSNLIPPMQAHTISLKRINRGRRYPGDPNVVN